MDHIKRKIEEAKKKVNEMQALGIYTEDHIREVKEEQKKEIAELAKELHETNIMELKKMQNEVIRKHDPTAAVKDPERPETKYRMTAEEKYKHLPEDWRNLQIEMDERRGIYEYDINGTPIVDGAVMEDATGRVKTRTEVDLEVNQKLLDRRRMETEIKAARTADLEGELEKLNTNKAGDIDRVNLVAAELRTRGKHDVADQLLDYTEAHNIREPWKNDPDFIAAEKKMKEQELFAVNDDLLFIGEDGDRPISINDIFEVDEEAEAKKRLNAEIAEYEAAEKQQKS